MNTRISGHKANTMTNTSQLSKIVNQLTACTAIALLGLATGAAHATVELTKTGANLFDGRTVQFGSVVPGGQSTMGAWKVNETNGAQNFWVYCLDPLHTSISPDTYDKVSLSNFVTAAAADAGYTKLFASTPYQANGIVNLYDDSTNATTAKVLNNLTSLYQHAYADSLTDAKKSAAFQYAIWEIEGDGAGAYSRTTGSFKYTGTDSADGVFTATVDKYLAGLNTGTWANGLTTVTNYTFNVYNPNPSGSGQAVMSATAVPEPGSLALAGLALFGMVYTRRQSKAKQL
ncbi:PEP-CTERM sorting domain-containing protein [Paucibacter sp. B2R-40]|uniref:PEP-CTERM sorting domain-containing protein n=1 Tax=Paucibacter sp. B2R-40 TaxID=2893554 RepID=UPI0021E4793B|nr:PEP-CTERM sorting domain-containing protein [Paucibacter sp. B2R-40]MCV2354110.1 PEP-CTERM sorting domain-containing protein [Paucibacter sp. B2R-40]